LLAASAPRSLRPGSFVDSIVTCGIVIELGMLERRPYGDASSPGTARSRPARLRLSQDFTVFALVERVFAEKICK